MVIVPVVLDPVTGQLVDAHTGEVIAEPRDPNARMPGRVAPEARSVPLLVNPIQASPASRRQPIRAARRETMANPTDSDAIKITAEDLASVRVPDSVVPTVAPSSGAKVYGTINETAEQFVSVPAERGSILLQGWFYLGLAGLLGALAGWGIAEPGFVDGPGHHWGNF